MWHVFPATIGLLVRQIAAGDAENAGRRDLSLPRLPDGTCCCGRRRARRQVGANLIETPSHFYQKVKFHGDRHGLRMYPATTANGAKPCCRFMTAGAGW